MKLTMHQDDWYAHQLYRPDSNRACAFVFRRPPAADGARRIRLRKIDPATKRSAADIEVGHRSAVLAHLANILAHTGRSAFTFDPEAERIVGDDEANALVGRTYREGHWAVPETG